MSPRIPVAVLAATGSVGQRFIQLLANHPWFEVTGLTASDRSIGKSYAAACHWNLPTPIPESIREIKILPTKPASVPAALVFSALPADAARDVEAEFARAGAFVCSNASAYRMAEDVPILLPEVNPQHLQILSVQQMKRGWSGGILTNSNCTSTGMTVALKALQDAFGLMRVFAVSLQAISGAGYPGVASMDILDNVIPYIGGEEEKVETEPLKILGSFDGTAIQPANFKISAHTNRVAVQDGHIVCLSVELAQPATPQQAAAVLADYQAPEVSRDLPSTPHPVIQVSLEPDRPQPRLDRMAGDGMTTVVGRVRPDPLFSLRLVVSSHNTIRGAAGGSIYNAELLYQQGWIKP